MRKKRIIPKRSRVVVEKGRRVRNPYERTLEHALNRRGRAMAEYVKYRERIAALEVELPRLEQIINSLTPMSETAAVTTAPPPSPVGRGASRRSPVDISTPEGLQRYMDSITAKGVSAVSGELFDRTLPITDFNVDDDNLPNLTGDEILP